MSRRVALTSIVDLTGSSIAGNGFQSAYLSANGYGGPDLAGYRVPQTNIWNQYAAMFDFYQVERIQLAIYPYKFETTSSVTGVNPVNARPIYSCLDPEDTGPGPNADGIASYGNLHVTAPYVPHKREFMYHQLGIQK